MRCPAATSAALPCRRGVGRGISRRNSSEVKSRIPKPAARRRAKYPRRPRRGTTKQGPAQGPAATSAALPCGRGCRGRGISRRNSSAGSIRGASAREVPAPPSARDVQAGSAQDPAATSAALPCRRGCKGRGISRRNSSAGAIRSASAREVPAPPSARDVQAGSAQGPAATSAALPCDRGCRGRAISPRNNSAGKIRSGPAREVPAPPSARDVQAGSGAGPGRDKRGPPVWSRVQGTRDFTSEQFRSEIPHHQTHDGSVAELCSAQRERERGGGGGAIGICGRGRHPRRPAPGAERCGAAHCVGSGGRAGRAPLPMSGHSIVRHARAIVRHIGAIVHQSQPTWEIRADVPRRGRRGYIAHQGSVHVREL